MTTLSGSVRLAFLGFFASHIFVTLLMAGQAVLPSVLYPSFLQGLLPLYVAQFKDTLLTEPLDIWFQAFVACEVAFQVPFFVVAVRVLAHIDTYSAAGSSWFKTLCLIYGTHATTTLIPILATSLFNDVNTVNEKTVLFGFYVPYLIMPAWLVYICCNNENILAASSAKEKSS